MKDFATVYDLNPPILASAVSNFLNGKAYEYFATTISEDPSKWGLGRIFRGLFNYCFPIDFRLSQREKLKRCYQRDRTVREFIHELELLFILVGHLSKREKVDKLWHGFNAYIQKELWRERLSPEASWEEVVEAAEIIEMAERAAQKGAAKPLKDGNGGPSTL